MNLLFFHFFQMPHPFPSQEAACHVRLWRAWLLSYSRQGLGFFFTLSDALFAALLHIQLCDTVTAKEKKRQTGWMEFDFKKDPIMSFADSKPILDSLETNLAFEVKRTFFWFYILAKKPFSCLLHSQFGRGWQLAHSGQSHSKITHWFILGQGAIVVRDETK